VELVEKQGTCQLREQLSHGIRRKTQESREDHSTPSGNHPFILQGQSSIMSLRKYINHARLSKCNDWFECLNPNTEGRTYIDPSGTFPISNLIHLCLKNIGSGQCAIEETMLHEMLHRCGAGNHPTNPETAPAWFAKECIISNDCSMKSWNPPIGLI